MICRWKNGFIYYFKSQIEKGTSDDPYRFWTEDDYDKEFSSILTNENDTESDNVRVFKCYLEDWEKVHLRKKDDVSKAKFLHEYGGLEFDDVDEPFHYWIDDSTLHFQNRHKDGSGGWCVCTTSNRPTDNEESEGANQ